MIESHLKTSDKEIPVALFIGEINNILASVICEKSLKGRSIFLFSLELPAIFTVYI